MNRSQQPNRRSLFGRASTRRLQERLPTGFGGGNRSSSSIAVCTPRNASPSYLEDNNSSGAFERCGPRAPCVRDPLMPPSTIRTGGDVLQGPSSNAPPRSFARGSREQAALGGTFHREIEVREDYTHSALRRARVANQRSDEYYYGHDSIIEAMPSTLPPSLYDGFTSGASRRNRGVYPAYQQEDSIVEPMPRNLSPLKAPPSCISMESYEEALSRKMAAYEKPVAVKKTNPVLPAAPAAIQTPAAPATTTNFIEISPGVTARLRGAQETMNCIANDFYVPTTCYCCATNLFCIMDADYVLCPVCKVVSPVGDNDSSYDGGIGLGFTFEDLQHYQEEILNGRCRA